MDHKEVGKYWDGNAEVWTKLARMGCDIYRDYMNTPAFLEMLPDVDGLTGLDIGCGEGYNTRLVAKRGAKMSAIDISSVFIKHAQEAEQAESLGIEYQIASAVELLFADESFDFAMATMSLMDIPETEEVIKEAYRVIKPGGFLQFSISHPCFVTPMWEWIRDENGKQLAIKCGDYFKKQQGRIVKFIFTNTPKELRNILPEFQIPCFYLTLSEWLNLLIETGFVLEYFAEPKADEKTVEKVPHLRDSQIVAYFLIIRCRKR